MLDVLHAEFFKFKGMFKRYYIDSIAEILSYLILFVGLTYSIINTSKNTDNIITQLVIGIFIWYIGINAIAIFTFILQEEMQLGTLEQIYMTKTSLTKMLFGRAIGTFIFDAVGGITLSSLTIVFLLIFSPNLVIDNFDFSPLLNPLTYLVIILTMIGIYGFSFILAGISIVYKKISAVTVILNYVFLFFTGILVTGNSLPILLDIFSKFLPITWGIICINDIFLGKFDLYHFLLLILNSLIYIVIGVTSFKYMTYIARIRGSLDHY